MKNLLKKPFTKKPKKTSALTTEKNKYQRIWELKEYRGISPALELWRDPGVQASLEGITLLDAGCGDCSLHLETDFTNDYRVTGLDIASNANPKSRKVEFLEGTIWREESYKNRSWDLVFCCDVMEHIPPAYVRSSFKNLQFACKKKAIFSIYTSPDQLGPKLIGEPLHLTVKPGEWWASLLDEYFTISYVKRGLQDKRWIFIGSPR